MTGNIKSNNPNAQLYSSAKDALAEKFEYYANSIQRNFERQFTSGNSDGKPKDNPFIKSPKFGDQNETQLS